MAQMTYKRKQIAALCLAMGLLALVFGVPAWAGEAYTVVRLTGIVGREPTDEEIRAAGEAVASAAGGYVAHVFPALSKASGSGIMMIASDGESDEELIARLRALPQVLDASPNMAIPIAAKTPNDKYFNSSSAASPVVNSLWGLHAIGAPAAWDKTTGRKDIYVAVIDTGYTEHEDLKDNVDLDIVKNYHNIFYGDDRMSNDILDEDGHGTHVAGTIGAVGNNEKGVVGVNWAVKIMPFNAMANNILSSKGSLGNTDIRKALDYILKELRKPNPLKLAAINMSYGAHVSTAPDQYTEIGTYEMRLLSQLPNAPLMVCAAGNEKVRNGAVSSDGKAYYHYPSSLSTLNDSVISVAAVGPQYSSDNSGTTVSYKGADYTNWGSTIDVSAPGGYRWGGTVSNGPLVEYIQPEHQQILSTGIKGNDYVARQGTSMATPHVAGAAALLAAYLEDNNMPWDGALLKDALIKTADKDANPTSIYSGSEPISKHGLIRVDKAMTYLEEKKAIPISSVTITANKTEIPEKSYVEVTATILPDDTPFKKVIWRTDNESSAKIVDSTPMSAKLYCESAGSATITATAAGSVSGQITITVGTTPATHEHDFGAPDWASDEYGHWKVCPSDNAPSSSVSHTSEWAQDASQHYKVCAECGREYQRGDHKTTNNTLHRDSAAHWKVCDDCGLPMEIEAHEPGSQYDSDADKHRHICTKCGANTDEADHEWNADLESNATHHWHKCNVCSYEEAPGTAHNWSATYEKDGSHHWKKCTVTGCKATTTKEPHNYNQPNDKCVCGAANPNHNHTYDMSKYESDDDDHWHLCTVCNEKVDVTRHTVKWNSNGASGHSGVCSVCNKTISSAPHRWNSVKEQDADNHWSKCADCGHEADKAPHRAEAGKWERNADAHWQKCAEEGCGREIGRAAHEMGADGTAPKCSVCGLTNPGHTHVYPAGEWKYDSGSHWRECTACADGAKIDAAAHKLSMTSNAAGHASFCSVCGARVNDEAHRWNARLEFDASGHWYKCGICAREDKDGAVRHSAAGEWSRDALYHWHNCANNGCGAKVGLAAHDNDGNGGACSVCGMGGSGHTHSYDPTKWLYDSSLHWHVCDADGVVMGEERHLLEWRRDTGNGTHWQLCAICGYTSGEEPHRFGGGWKSSTLNHWRECADCGAAGAASDHYDSGGSEACDVCGAGMPHGMTIPSKKPAYSAWQNDAPSSQSRMEFTTTIPFERFVSVQVDNRTVGTNRSGLSAISVLAAAKSAGAKADDGVTVSRTASGMVSVELSASFLAGLSAGEHTLKVLAEDSYAETRFTTGGGGTAGGGSGGSGGGGGCSAGIGAATLAALAAIALRRRSGR